MVLPGATSEKVLLRPPIVKTPQALYHAYGALAEEKKLGPILKTAIAVTLPIAAALTPPLTAVGSIVFGAYRGFTEAGVEASGDNAQKGIANAISEGFKDIGRFHNDAAVLAAPLAVAGGALYGLGVGAYDAYNKGFGTAIEEQISDVKSFNSAVKETLDDI